MSRPRLHIPAYLALALASLALTDGADAGVGGMSGGGLSSIRHLSPLETVQYSGDCWYDNGWNGPGYYPCGNEWNSGFGGAGPVAPIVVPATRRHRHGVILAHPQLPKPIYPGATSPSLGGGVPSSHFHGAVGTPALGFSGVSPGWRRAGNARVSSNIQPGATTVTPGFAGGGFHGGLGGGNFHQFHNAGIPHIGGPVSPGLPGAGGFHPGGAIGTPHIGAPVSPSFAGTFHPGGIGTPHIGAPASPGLAGGGFHGVGGAAVFQGGGGAFGQGGIGHR